jgi:ABC-type sugar transport system permease subunit
MSAKKNARSERMGYVFILPWVIGFLVFTAFPIFYSLYLSFFKVRITATGIQTTFLKFQNYVDAVTGDIDFINNIVSFLTQVFPTVILVVIISLLIALLLNKKIVGRGLFRTIFFLPVIIASGPILVKLQTLGITKIPNLDQFSIYVFAEKNPGLLFTTFLTFVLNNIVMLLWLSGVQILIFLSALQKNDKSTYEAAKIDGASQWEIFWKITLPSLTPMILINVVYTTVMYSISSLNPIIGQIQTDMFQIKTGFGYSAALSWLYFILIVIVQLVFVGVIRLFSKSSSDRR